MFDQTFMWSVVDRVLAYFASPIGLLIGLGVAGAIIWQAVQMVRSK